MTLEAKAIVLVALVCVVGYLGVGYLRSWMGKPTRGTLHVPLGKNHLPITVHDDGPLKPYKFGQVFEALVVPAGQAGEGIADRLPAGSCALRYRGKTIGFTETNSSYTKALLTLAEAHPKVLVRVVVQALDEKGKPIVRINLPQAPWFVRATKNTKEHVREPWTPA